MALSREIRDLSDSERRLLKWKITSVRKLYSRAPYRVAVVCSFFGAVLCGLTLLASSAAPSTVVGVWVCITVVLTVWVTVDVCLGFKASVTRLEGALQHNRAEVVHVTAQECVAFEEIDDEGDCYAFQSESGEIVFVVGQDFYELARFPNADFSLVHIHVASGQLVEMLVVKHGPKLVPVRTVPASVKAMLRIPEHLEVIHGSLAQIEDCLNT